MAMDKKMIAALVALLLVVAAAIGFVSTQSYDKKGEAIAEKAKEKQEVRVQDACASNGTYARLKEVVFEEAVRIRNSDPANLDTLAAHSVVRMENPVVKSRDEDLNVTVCTGRFVLEVPPGAEAAFGGERRLTADIQYAAQAAADGSGLVYQMTGAEPIIYRLASFDLRGRRPQPPGAPADGAQLAEAPPAPDAPVAPEPEADVAPTPPAPTPPPAPVARPRQPQPAPPPRAPARSLETAPARSTGTARPSFSCRSGRSRSEQMVCSSARLAAKDRAMSSLFYSALSDADPRTRALLRRTRDRFLAYRERCGSEACVAEAYDGRMEEIRDIMAESE